MSKNSGYVQKRIPDTVSKNVLIVILALIPALVTGMIFSPVFDSSEFDVTVIERLDNGTSTIDILIQNVGNSPSTNILILFDFSESYKIINYETTDAIPQSIIDNGILRISLDRLSPQNYASIQVEGDTYSQTKTFWISSDEQTKILQLTDVKENSGISSVNLSKETGIAYLSIMGFSFASFFIFRYYKFYKSEYTRRAYLGVHKISMVRFRSTNATIGVIIIVLSFSISTVIDGYIDPLPLDDYIAYDQFVLTDVISLEKFFQTNYSDDDLGTVGIWIMIIMIFPMLHFSTRDIKLPSFIWSLPPSLDTIKIKDISLSFITSEQISIHTVKEISDIDVEVFAIYEKDEIMGLVSKDVAKKFRLGKKLNLKTVFNEKSRSLKKKKLNIDKNNFVVVNKNASLELLRHKMESTNKKYAVIEDDSEIFVGVVAYDDLFIEPKLF